MTVNKCFFTNNHFLCLRFYNRAIGKRHIKKRLKLISIESDNEKQKIKKIWNAKFSMQTVIRDIKKYINENNLPNKNFTNKISKPRVISEKPRVISSKPRVISEKIIIPKLSENNSEPNNNGRTEFFVLKENVMHTTGQFYLVKIILQII